MRLRTIGSAQGSGLCIGGNPFSGFSHQSPERNQEMLDYHTPERIHEVLRTAEDHGINTFGCTDAHFFGALRDLGDAGGQIQWFAQVCIERGCTGAYIHGGVVDNWHAAERWDLFEEVLGRMRDAGVVSGFAAHQPQAQAWIRDHLDPDFQMCSYYNPTDRSKSAHHQDSGEKWEDEDRDAMLEVIANITRPVVHYKLIAGGTLCEDDVALIGVFLKDHADLIAEDVDLFDKHVDAVLA